ncbi:hypothetical protein BDZ97DRAFT_1757239 [Flammula alnicola]|nr:hypothetical protein BDZ97DRAFT_1757239 [Flammula alnicola]
MPARNFSQEGRKKSRGSSRKDERSRKGNAVHRNYAKQVAAARTTTGKLNKVQGGKPTKRKAGDGRDQTENEKRGRKDTNIGLVDASRASLSLLLVLPVDPSRRWCFPFAAAAIVGTAIVGTYRLAVVIVVAVVVVELTLLEVGIIAAVAVELSRAAQVSAGTGLREGGSACCGDAE